MVELHRQRMKLLYAIVFLLFGASLSNHFAQQSQNSTPSQRSSDRNHAPSVYQIRSLLRRADHIVVANASNNGATMTTLFESDKKSDIDQLLHALDISVPKVWRFTICGNPDIIFYKGQTKLLTITNMGGSSIATSIWEGDYLIKNVQGWLKWFDERGIKSPRLDYEADADRKKSSDVALKKWIDGMPAGVSQIWDQVISREYIGVYEIAPIRKALASNYRKVDDQILALLSWYGSGEGRWSGFPAYEDVAEECLLGFYSTDEIVAAISTTKLSASQLEGAARHFAGWDFQHTRPSDVRLIPGSLKRQLLDHSLASNDEDKRRRAVLAFKLD